MDLITLSDLLVDMFPAEIGRRLADVSAFYPKPGGASANVAVAAQRLGVHRHTLRHRVERAADVAGFDLDDASHRALLLLTLGAADARPVETTGGPGPP